MYLCYVDESGDPGPKGSSHLVLTGAAVFEGKWSYLRQDLERLIARYWPAPPRPSEIHLVTTWTRVTIPAPPDPRWATGMVPARSAWNPCRISYP